MSNNWLDLIEQKFEVEIDKVEGNDHFIATQYIFSDPNKNGLEFELCFDEKGIPSLFSTSVFEFQWFNAAENISTDDFYKAAEMCLTGNLIFKKGFLRRGYKLMFDLPTFKGTSKLVAPASDADILNWKTGYKKRAK